MPETSWPPIVDELVEDLDIDGDLDAGKLERDLAAAISFVQRVRKDVFEQDEFGLVIEPAAFTETGEREADSIHRGTLALAGRWYARRRSPDGALITAEGGSGSIRTGDPDIDRQLRLGVHQRMVMG